MYMNPQWSERSLTDEIRDLVARIEKLGDPQDRKGKHTVSYLKQMVKAKREKLAALKFLATG
jgi:hypothetical protein